MLTGLDKALTAFIMAGLFLLNNFGIVPWTPTPETEASISIVIGALTPLLVYLVPNRKV